MSDLKPDDSLSIPRTSTIERGSGFHGEGSRHSPGWPWHPTLPRRQLQGQNRWTNQPRVFKHLKDLEATDRQIRQRYTSTPPQPDAI